MAIASQELHTPAIDLKKRATLRWLRDGALGIGALAVAHGINRLGFPLYEQNNAWNDVDCPTETFLRNNKTSLERMQFGTNILPDYRLNPNGCDPQIVIDHLRNNFNCSQIRLSTRWRTYDEQGIEPYAGYIHSALKNDMSVVISYGAKTPGWPETKFPDFINENIENFGVQPGGTIHTTSELGKHTLEYSHNFLNDLDREFGLTAFAGFNFENEHSEKHGEHRLNIGEDLLFAHAQLLTQHIDSPRVLLNSICISPPWEQSPLLINIKRAIKMQKQFLGLRADIGADIYEETPAGRINENWYVDTLAGIDMIYGSDMLPTAQQYLSENNIPFEVSEGCQLGDWVVEPRKYQPGSRIHAQYLISRMGTKLIHSDLYTPDNPLLIRLWEMEPLLAAMQKDKNYFDNNETLQLLQKINYRDFPS